MSYRTRDMSVSEGIEKFLDMYLSEFVMKEIHLLNIFGHYLVTIMNMHNIVIMIRKTSFAAEIQRWYIRTKK